MPDQSHKQTPYDQFNFEIPQKFPEQGVSADALIDWTRGSRKSHL
jgi:hypothetical protein